MVRELERPSAEPVTLTVDLPQDPQEADRVAERALGTITRFLNGVPRCSSPRWRRRDRSLRAWRIDAEQDAAWPGPWRRRTRKRRFRTPVRTLQAIKRANRPGRPEHSIRLRAACFFTVTAAIAACASMGEVSDAAALGAIGLVALGMVFSYLTRRNPPGWVKIVVAAGAIGVSAWFVRTR